MHLRYFALVVLAVPVSLYAAPQVDAGLFWQYRAIVVRYMQGQPSATAASELSPVQMVRTVKRLREALRSRNAEALQSWSVPLLDAALVMHLDAYVDGARRERITPWHLECALLLSDAYATIDDRAVHRRSLYVIAWLLQITGQFDQLRSHLDSASRAYPRAVELHVARGAMFEAVGSPRHGEGGRSSLEGLDAAEAAYRGALAIDKALVEPRVRLGYVLLRANKVSQARAELTLALSQPSVPRLTYLNALFLGSALEAAGDLPDAVRAYQRAVAALPGCQVAGLALANAQGLTGLDDASRETAARAAAIGPETCEDPWWSYDYGQAWQLEELLRDLRDAVRK